MMVKKTYYCVIGLGITGLSCIDFLRRQNCTVVAFDTRAQPNGMAECQKNHPEVVCHTGEDWPQSVLDNADFIVVSPGVSILHPAIVTARSFGAEVMGDIELFARFNDVPVIAITGANGKSTVTTMVGEMARFAGKRVAVVGNIGTPVLQAFNQDTVDIIVMELSSFQLETTTSLRPLVATVLNITPDHMDRYATFEDYVAAKHRIFKGASHIVINKDDPYSDCPPSLCAKRWYFTASTPVGDEFGFHHNAQEVFLAKGNRDLLSLNDLNIVGQHNGVNALSALAIGTAAGFDEAAMIAALKAFKGLEHRCQWVAKMDGITWFNDSKGTNVGATQASLQGLGERMTGKIVLILGGDGKGADFKGLIPFVKRYCRAIVVKGKDANRILTDLHEIVPSHHVEDMKEAVTKAREYAQAGDSVLLSPACSSLDQYRDYNHRGQVFIDLVKKMVT